VENVAQVVRMANSALDVIAAKLVSHQVQLWRIEIEPV